MLIPIAPLSSDLTIILITYSLKTFNFVFMVLFCFDLFLCTSLFCFQLPPPVSLKNSQRKITDLWLLKNIYFPDGNQL